MVRIFLAIILFLGAGGVGFLYLKPTWQDFRAVRDQSQKVSNLSSEFDDLIRKRDELLTAISAIPQEDLERLDAALPQGSGVKEFVIFLDRLSAKRNLVLKKIDFKAASVTVAAPASQPRPGGAPLLAPKKGEISEFPFSLSIAGSYENMKEFLKDLEKHIRIVDVGDISFNAASAGKVSIYDFTIRAKTYHQ